MTCSADPSREESKLSSPSRLARDTTKEAREREGKERRGKRGREEGGRRKGGGGKEKRGGKEEGGTKLSLFISDKYMCMNAIPYWSYGQLSINRLII